MKNCKQCHQQFTIYPEDKEFYRRIDVPEPTLCPDCRLQRRLVFRNERALYNDKCDLSGEKMISMYDPKGHNKVYCEKAWWGNDWEPLDYGRDFDFSKTFFENFKNLYLNIPKFALYNFDQENSEYCNYASHQKNCYLIYGSWHLENCYYGNTVIKCTDCIDNFFISDCTKCYQLIDCVKCYESFYLQNCNNCMDSWLLFDCRNCQNCLFSYNLRHKKNYLFNKPVSKQEIDYYKNDFLSTPGNLQNAITKFKSIVQEKAIHKYMLGEKNENSSGDSLYNCKNVHDSYYVYDGENVVRTFRSVDGIKDSYDNFGTSKDEFVYECINIDCSQKCRFCFNGEHNTDCDYCMECFNLKDSFGCHGLRKNQYCILNKKYSKEEYYKIKKRIIGHMEKTGEWGEFFPVSLSPFAYNETIAIDYFPLSKKKVIVKGWIWKDEVKKEPSKNLSICKICNKNFKFISAEKNFYNIYHLPMPDKCPNCRHIERFNLRNSYKLWNNFCFKCRKEMKTVYSSKKLEQVYCEKCYNQAIY